MEPGGFFMELVFEITGIIIMSKITSNGFKLYFHGITSLLTILLMLFRAIWATVVLVK